MKDELESLQNMRALRRDKRRSSLIPAAAIIGYTNAGKSTLMNDFFATLDPTTRRYYLSNGRTILLTDTVGFIQHIPHKLIESFHATLEEVTEADLLIHVVDVSHPEAKKQMEAVYRVLEELGATKVPVLTVLNKADRIQNVKKISKELKHKPYVICSALNRQGLEELEKEIIKLIENLKFPAPQP